MILALAAALLVGSPTVVVLERGPDFPTVRDTFVNASEPDRNYGRDWQLEAGDSRAILIDFDHLESRLGSGAKIVSAKLVLQKAGPGAATLKRCAVLADPWIEGGGRRALGQLGFTRPGTPRLELGTTWKVRGMSPTANEWQGRGAAGPSDAATISGATLVDHEDSVEITGLAGAVQQELDQPGGSFGFVLNVQTAAAFFSSDAPAGRPRLVLEVESGPVPKAPDLRFSPFTRSGDQLKFDIENGGGRESQKATLRVWQNGRRLADQQIPSLGSGEHASFAVSADLSKDHLDLAILHEGIEGSRANNSASYTGGGVDVGASADNLAAVSDAVRQMNEVWLPLSRTSFAPDGPRVRVNLIASATALAGDPVTGIRAALGLPDWRTCAMTKSGFPTDPYPGLAGGDRRDDTAFSPLLPLTYDIARNELAEDGSVQDENFLSMTDVAILERVASIPKSVIARLVDATGSPLAGSAVAIVDPERKVLAKLQTNADGYVNVDPQWFAGSMTGIVGVVATTKSGAASGTIKAWHAVDAAARAGRSLAMLKVGMVPLANASGTNVALRRPIIATSLESATTKVLTDDKTDEGISFDAGASFTLDLGRDHLIGSVQVVFTGPIRPSELRLSAWNTGQTEASQRPLATATSLGWLAQNYGAVEGSTRTVTLSFTTQPVRYLKVALGKGSASIVEIRALVPEN